ncbi:MAG: hypothetical protein NT062_29695, partial [Proteobacteria bacterium]|nr:hypothetical protein [Pseudomonadota bacterium]
TADAQPKRHQWDSKGWVMLVEQTVDYARHTRRNRDASDTDRITVGRYEGRFSKLQLIVDDSDMTLNSMKVVFADNSEFNPQLAYEFREGQRTRVIDLPGNDRTIKYIDLDYKNSGKRDREKARVQVWGWKVVAPVVKRFPWDTHGWTMLGEQTVDYARHTRRNRDASDTDRITVGRYEGRFGKLQLVVDDSDMTLNAMKIVFADNTEYNPKLAYDFKEGQRTRQFDLPPSENVIKYIDLDYRNSGKRDGEKARVQVWGLLDTGPRPRPRR